MVSFSDQQYHALDFIGVKFDNLVYFPNLQQVDPNISKHNDRFILIFIFVEDYFEFFKIFRTVVETVLGQGYAVADPSELGVKQIFLIVREWLREFQFGNCQLQVSVFEFSFCYIGAPRDEEAGMFIRGWENKLYLVNLVLQHYAIPLDLMLLKQYPYERVSGPIFEYAGIVIPDLLEALQVHLHIILRYKLEQAGIRFVDENYA